MDPFTLMLILGAASQVGGAIYSYVKENNAAADAQKILDLAQQKYGGINPPAFEKAAQDVLGPTKFNQIVQDPKYRQAQGDALASLKTVADQGGLTAADKANLNRIQTGVENTANAREQNVLESFRNRGAGNASNALVASLGAGQSAANRQAQEGLDIAGQAQRNALDATQRRGQLASQFSEADWRRDSEKARAQDAINEANWGRRYNATNQNNQNAQTAYQNALGQQATQYGFAQQQAGAAKAAGERAGRLGTTMGNAVGGGLAGAAGEWNASSGGYDPSAGGQVTLTNESAPYDPAAGGQVALTPDDPWGENNKHTAVVDDRSR